MNIEGVADWRDRDRVCGGSRVRSSFLGMGNPIGLFGDEDAIELFRDGECDRVFWG